MNRMEKSIWQKNILDRKVLFVFIFVHLFIVDSTIYQRIRYSWSLLHHFLSSPSSNPNQTSIIKHELLIFIQEVHESRLRNYGAYTEAYSDFPGLSFCIWSSDLDTRFFFISTTTISTASLRFGQKWSTT